MLEAIRTIGEIILKDSGEDIIENLILDFPPEIKGKKQHIIIIDLNVFDKTITFASKEISQETPMEFLWVGSADKSRSPQIYLTVKSSNISHLLSQAVPNIFKRCAPGGRLYILLKMVLESLFVDLGFSGKDKYILDGEALGLVEKGFINKSLEDSRQNREKKSETSKKILGMLKKGLMKRIKEDKEGPHLSKTNIGLYTLTINGEILAQNGEYRNIIIKEKIDSIFEKEKKICSCCNSLESYTDNPNFAKAKSALGFYITQKYGFSSTLSGSFSDRFSICKACYKKLLVGEIFVRNNFSSMIGELNVYIIPKFFFSADINKKKFNEWSEYILHSFNSIKTYNGLEAFVNKLEDFREMETLQNSFSLNLLFWQPGTGSETKVLKLVNDIAPLRLSKLRAVSNIVGDIGADLFGQSSFWYINLQKIYYLIPLRKRKGKEGTWLEYRKILELYDCIFSGKPVSKNFLIDQFVKVASIFNFEQFETCQIQKPKGSIEKEFINKILQANLFLNYLRELDLLKEGEKMDYENVDIDDNIKKIIREMKYDEQKTAMFLLGTLVGKIGNAQYNKSISGKKTILKKINFQGINPNKLIRLSNEIPEKLIEYKQLQYCEMRYSQFKQLIDKNIKDWDLSDQENVFYLLSGYAYETKLALNKAKDKKSKNNQDNPQDGEQGVSYE
jgi:CRISPR-associated protein Csh1